MDTATLGPATFVPLALHLFYSVFAVGLARLFGGDIDDHVDILAQIITDFNAERILDILEGGEDAEESIVQSVNTIGPVQPNPFRVVYPVFDLPSLDARGIFSSEVSGLAACYCSFTGGGCGKHAAAVGCILDTMRGIARGFSGSWGRHWLRLRLRLRDWLLFLVVVEVRPTTAMRIGWRSGQTLPEMGVAGNLLVTFVLP
jgi:hypothetical protein